VKGEVIRRERIANRCESPGGHAQFAPLDLYNIRKTAENGQFRIEQGKKKPPLAERLKVLGEDA
jgi:hypothetical protein